MKYDSQGATIRYVCLACLNTLLDNKTTYCKFCIECGDQMCPLTAEIRDDLADSLRQWKRGSKE